MFFNSRDKKKSRSEKRKLCTAACQKWMFNTKASAAAKLQCNKTVSKPHSQHQLETNGSIGLHDLLKQRESGSGREKKEHLWTGFPCNQFFWQTVSRAVPLPINFASVLGSIKREGERKNFAWRKRSPRGGPRLPPRLPPVSFCTHLFELANI